MEVKPHAPDASGGKCPFAGSVSSLLDPAVQREPNEFYRWLRDTDPVHWDETLHMFIVSKAALIREAAEDTERFSSVGSLDFPREQPLCPAAAAIRATTYDTKPLTIVVDPPVHTQYRKIMNGALSIPRMRAARPLIERLVNDLLEKLLATKGGDLVEDFAVALPFALITEMMGLPRDMAPRVRQWAAAYIDQLIGRGSTERQMECANLYVEYHQYFAARVERCRAQANPPDDLVTCIALARLDDGSLMPMVEVLAMIEQFIVAGAETTTNALTMGMLTLARRSDLMARLRADHGAADAFAEEVLRLFAPSQGLFRVATRDTELGGTPIPKGARIMLRWAAGNTDGDVFVDAEQLDLSRPNAHQHLTFGHGPHKCQGATLARIELSTAFRTIATMVDKMSIADEGQDVEYIQAPTFMGLKRLVVRLAPRQTADVAH